MLFGRADSGYRARARRRAIYGTVACAACLGFQPTVGPAASPEPVLPELGLAPGIRPDTLRTESNRPTVLALDAGLLSKLQVLADGLHSEIVLCLHGQVRGDTAHASWFTMPVPRRSNALRASFAPCEPDTVAVWHNHPVQPPGFRAPRTVTDTDPTGLCRLSPRDVRTAAGTGHPFAVVSVDSSTLCWWSLKEVRRLERTLLP